MWAWWGRLDAGLDQELFDDSDIDRLDCGAGVFRMFQRRWLHEAGRVPALLRVWHHLNRWGDFFLNRTGLNLRHAWAISPLWLAPSPRSRSRGLTLGSRSLTLGAFLSFQDPGPIEFDIRIVLLDQADGIFVKRGSPDTHPGRGAKPVQDPRTRLSAPSAPGAVRMHDKRVLVTAFVARKPQVWQIYFLF